MMCLRDRPLTLRAPARRSASALSAPRREFGQVDDLDDLVVGDAEGAPLAQGVEVPAGEVAGVGDEAWWAGNQGVIAFRKGKLAGQVYFTGSKYGGEPVTTEVAKLVVGRIK